MLFTFSILLICQCIGEGIAFFLALPVPGPVIGMLLLFCALVLRPALLERMEATADALLQHLSLLFVPAGVGIFVAASTLEGQWPAVVAAVAGGTLVTLAMTALVMRLLLGARSSGKARASDE